MNGGIAPCLTLTGGALLKVSASVLVMVSRSPLDSILGVA